MQKTMSRHPFLVFFSFNTTYPHFITPHHLLNSVHPSCKPLTVNRQHLLLFFFFVLKSSILSHRRLVCVRLPFYSYYTVFIPTWWCVSAVLSLSYFYLDEFLDGWYPPPFLAPVKSPSRQRNTTLPSHPILHIIHWIQQLSHKHIIKQRFTRDAILIFLAIQYKISVDKKTNSTWLV